MNNVIVFGLDNELEIIDSLFAKYLKVPGGLLFIKNNRYPIFRKDYLNFDRYLENGLVSNQPFHPYLCVECVCEILLSKIYSDSGVENLYIRNPKLVDSKSFITEDLLHCDPVGRIMEYFPGIYKGDVLKPCSRIVRKTTSIDKRGYVMTHALDQDGEIWALPDGSFSNVSEVNIPGTEYRTTNIVYTEQEFMTDIHTICDLINAMYVDKVKCLLHGYNNNIVQFGYDTGKIELTVLGDIAAYRFNEIMEIGDE